MTYRDNDRIRNPDDPWHREWGIGSIIASLVAIVIMAGILAYGATQATDMPTRRSTISQPITSALPVDPSQMAMTRSLRSTGRIGMRTPL
jgi:hypothetical protein